ncbi:HemK2/MTQ2 family protein methyltransferase [Thermomonospora cellulosilytica]|uniref:Release factor glutamine methyltransferase n=1 Tax=Thermomonospora cellulosilytica TaxID=1411118 RepID=A0A7W3N128_9ACTN|nr:HemK2/MTQ2 family protein methyltransferase [Thermomonospora cellulosilytica]MBA9005577.1 release factor glutamine methyltransferase [Thermomonospora cellulosilytica]
MLRPPGVYRPQGDTALLMKALREAAIPPGARVLDLCTGTGAVAVAAALWGARHVTAVDVSARAVLAARANAALRRLPVRVLRGDLAEPVAGERFDLITANPPYVPCRDGEPPRHGAARAWAAGPRGRSQLDRLCASAPALLNHGGTMLVVHSALCGVQETLDALRDRGLKASVAARRREPFGPVMHARAAELEDAGLIRRGQRYEELVVIRADRTEPRG